MDQSGFSVARHVRGSICGADASRHVAGVHLERPCTTRRRVGRSKRGLFGLFSWRVREPGEILLQCLVRATYVANFVLLRC